MKKIILLPLFFLFTATLVAQNLPNAYQRLSSQGVLKNANADMMLIDSSHGYFFDISITDSMLIQRQFLDYNLHGQMTTDSSLALYLDTIELGWQNYLKIDYIYDGLARLINRTTFYGNYYTGGWVPENRELLFYLNSSSLIDYELLHYYDWNNSNWRNSDSTINTRNLLQQIEFAYRFGWSVNQGNYYATSYHSFTYNENGLEIADTTYAYYTPGIPSLSYLEVSTFNTLGQEIREVDYYWDENNSIWKEEDKVEFTYYPEGNVKTILTFDWDELQSGWISDEANYMTYYPDGSPHLWMNYELDENSGLMVKNFTFEFFSSLHVVVNTDELKPETSMQLYPNPSNGNVTIVSPEATQLQIFNMQGQLLREFYITDGKQLLDLSDLDPGMYFVRSQKGKLHQRLIIQ